MNEEKIEVEKSEPLNMSKYQILINARNFHYDNFSKWMTFFYVAVGAIAVAYTNVIMSAGASKEFLKTIEIPILSLAYLISILWYLSSKGYYYWSINFITLVNHYEKNILKWKENELIYAAFANEEKERYPFYPHRGANISTSKVAIFFAFCITMFWGCLLFSNLISVFGFDSIGLGHWISSTFIALVVSLLSGYLGQKFFSSDISYLKDLKLN